MPPPAVSLDGGGPKLHSHEAAAAGSVSLQADWACAWIRVVGPLDGDSIPRVLRGVQEACQARPRKLRLLLKDASGSPDAIAEVLSAATSLADTYRVRLVAHTNSPSASGWYRKVAWWRGTATKRVQTPAAA